MPILINNLNNDCGGTLAAAPGATSILLVNGSLAANASCTISLDLQVTATTAGSLTSPAVVLSSNQAPNATAAAITLTVTVPAPTFTMAFAPNPRTLSLSPSGVVATGTLTFTITNNAAIPLTGLSFNHTLPVAPPLTIGPGAPPALPASCGAGATLTATVGGNTIRFTGGSVDVGQTCTVTIPVQTGTLTATGDYNYPNSPVTLNSTQAAPVQTGPVTWRVVVN
ncbi:DUF7933 domain-containing protein [Thermostichus sp. MS-CIW-15]